jgi:uncharacterized membrane protein
VLGVFVGIFAYCLVVILTIRGDDDLRFVPSIAVLGAFVLALVGMGFLIYFIHHVADALQASSILARVVGETARAVDRGPRPRRPVLRTHVSLIRSTADTGDMPAEDRARIGAAYESALASLDDARA